MSNDELCKKFVETDKSLIIAPAGYGKTHTLAESLRYANGKQLVLTHTHAGVAALKRKVNELGVPKSNFHIETISSFAQKYAISFNCGDIPEQRNSEEYYPFIIQKAKKLFKKKNIKDILKITYKGLFVDEYQDCTVEQDAMLSVLAETLPIHILGDPMQGIFGFRGQSLVNFTQLKDYSVVGELETPWRWILTNQALGNSMHEARLQLEHKFIDLACFKDSAEILIINNSEDIVRPRTDYNNLIWRHINSKEDLLLIHPESSNIYPRLNLCKVYKRRFSVIEAIDAKCFYDFASMLDELRGSKSLYTDLVLLIKGAKSGHKRTNTLLTGLNDFLKDDKPPNRSRDPKKSEIISLINKILGNFSFMDISKLLTALSRLTDVNCYRRELFWDIVKSLSIAEQENISVLEAMEGIRNRIRSSGKRVYGRSIGTTLLTKGLEFDSVIVLDAHKFQDENNLYVALSRASKNLIVISEKSKLSW